jgi:hypothetical protein
MTDTPLSLKLETSCKSKMQRTRRTRTAVKKTSKTRSLQVKVLPNYAEISRIADKGRMEIVNTMNPRSTDVCYDAGDQIDREEEQERPNRHEDAADAATTGRPSEAISSSEKIVFMDFLSGWIHGGIVSAAAPAMYSPVSKQSADKVHIHISPTQKKRMDTRHGNQDSLLIYHTQFKKARLRIGKFWRIFWPTRLTLHLFVIQHLLSLLNPLH